MCHARAFRHRTMDVAKAGRKKKTKKARGIQNTSPTKKTNGMHKRTRHKRKMRGLFARLQREGAI